MKLRAPYAIAFLIFFMSTLSYGGGNDPSPPKGTDKQGGQQGGCEGCGRAASPTPPTPPDGG